LADLEGTDLQLIQIKNHFVGAATLGGTFAPDNLDHQTGIFSYNPEQSVHQFTV
jgi:hypothetical protein